MLESWKEASDKDKPFGALIMDLSKAFDCPSHDLFIPKLYLCGLELSSLKLIQD